MQNILTGLISIALVSAALAAQAKELMANDRVMCSLGAGTAARAQEFKLSGISLYADRQKIQA